MFLLLVVVVVMLVLFFRRFVVSNMSFQRKKSSCEVCESVLAVVLISFCWTAPLTHPATILQADTLFLNSEKMEEKMRFSDVKRLLAREETHPPCAFDVRRCFRHAFQKFSTLSKLTFHTNLFREVRVSTHSTTALR